MDLQKIISATLLAGAHLPAFKALYDTVVNTFGEKDQAKLKAAYADAIAKSDAAHRDAQGL